MKNQNNTENNTVIKLRAAGLNDVPLLRYWDQQHHVIAAAPNDEWDWDSELRRNPDWQEILIAELNGSPIGVIQIMDPALEETHYWGDIEENCRAIDIWIGDAKNLGKGYGTEMMRLAFERCFADPKVTTIWIDPLETNTKAHRFYERLGFRFVEKRRFGEDDCLVYRINRDEWSQRMKAEIPPKMNT